MDANNLFKLIDDGILGVMKMHDGLESLIDAQKEKIPEDQRQEVESKLNELKVQKDQINQAKKDIKDALGKF